MNGFLKQSTAGQVRTVGPFVDDTDFKTLEDGLTIANTDIKLKKNGGASANKNSGGATADGAGGLYHLTWDATDTATVGELTYSIKVAGALVSFGSYVVLEEAVYDAMFAASANAWSGAAGSSTVTFANTSIATVTDVTNLHASAATAAELAKVPKSDSNVTWNATALASINTQADTALTDYDAPTRAELTSDINSVLARLRWVVIVDGTIGATGNDTTHVHLDGLTYGNDEINGYMLVVYDVSEDEYHWRKITDWVLATELATVDALPFTPQNSTDTYALLATLAAADVTGGDATAANQATIISLLGTPADTDLATDIANVQTDVDAILVDTAEIGAAGAGLTNINLPNQTMDIVGNITGNLSGSVGSVTGAVGSVTGNVGGNVAGSVGSVTGAVGSVTGNVGGNVAGSVGSVTGAINTAAGVITTLDGLDTAQDTQHSTTQSAIATVDTEVGIIDGIVDSILVDTTQIKADLPSRITKNTALSAFEFLMVDETDGYTAETGLTITATRSIDGGAFASCTNSATEVGTGIYKIDLSAADLNGDVITLRFVATGARTRVITIVTQP